MPKTRKTEGEESTRFWDAQAWMESAAERRRSRGREKKKLSARLRGEPFSGRHTYRWITLSGCREESPRRSSRQGEEVKRKRNGMQRSKRTTGGREADWSQEERGEIETGDGSSAQVVDGLQRLRANFNFRAAPGVCLP